MAPFADRYIQNNVVYPVFINEKVPEKLAVIVMIPCLNEPEILRTIESLWKCDPIESFCEVIVAVNNSELAATDVKNFNLYRGSDFFPHFLEYLSRRFQFRGVGSAD